MLKSFRLISQIRFILPRLQQTNCFSYSANRVSSLPAPISLKIEDRWTLAEWLNVTAVPDRELEPSNR